MPSINEAHPRVSGENKVTFVMSLVLMGSSPRERGKLWVSTNRYQLLGLIPA